MANGSSTDWLSGAGSGAITGATAGSMFGPWGTAIGAGIGAVGGGLMSGLSAQQQQAAMMGLDYTSPNYDEVINWLKGNWSVPQLQNYNPVSYTEGFEQFLGQNKYFPQMNRFLNRITDTENRQYRQDLDRATPRLRGDIRQFSRNVSNLLDGRIPTSVQGQIRDSANEQAVLGGFGGSQVNRNLVARDLGRTSLDLTNMGAQQLPQVLSLSERMNPVRASSLSYLMTPQQLFSTEIGQEQFGNQVANQNAMNISNIENQRARMIAGLMESQATADATGMNTSNLLGYQQAMQPSPWISGISSGLGSLASMYGSGMFGGGSGVGFGAGGFGVPTGYGQGPYGSTYGGTYNNLPVYRPALA